MWIMSFQIQKRNLGDHVNCGNEVFGEEKNVAGWLKDK